MRRLRVAHVITRLCQGGAQENTFHTVRLANRERYDVDLISGPTLGHEGSIEDNVREAGIEVVRVPHLIRDPAPIQDWRALQHLQRLFDQNRYDIVHTHTSKAGYLARIAAHSAHVPIIVHTAHGNIFDGYFSPLKTAVFVRLERHAAQFTDRFIELTQSGVEANLRMGIGTRERHRVIFSGVDFAPFHLACDRRSQTRSTLGVSDDQLLVGGVGRLEPVKGFAYFVAALERIATAVPHAQFLLAGNGSQRTQLETMAAPLGRRVRFLGRRNDIPDLMAALDIFVLPSVNEGMGRVLLEAGAAETCIVATQVGGVPDLLEGGAHGVLVPPRDARAIADAVVALASDEERRRALAKSARDAFVPAYSLEEMVRQIEALYEEICCEKRIIG